MVTTLKTEDDIYTDVKTYMQAQIPTLTNWSQGSPENGIARAIAFGCTMLYKLALITYNSIFATTADKTALRNWYEVFNASWDNPSTAEARAQVLAMFRSKHLGTGPWYEQTVVNEFDEVTEAYFIPGRNGVNTATLVVLASGADVLSGTITLIEAYFNNATRKVGSFDLEVLTYSDVINESEVYGSG